MHGMPVSTPDQNMGRNTDFLIESQEYECNTQKVGRFGQAGIDKPCRCLRLIPSALSVWVWHIEFNKQVRLRFILVYIYFVL